MNARSLRQKWSEVIGTLGGTAAEPYRDDLEKLRSRINVSDQKVTIFIGDLENGDVLAQDSQAPLEAALQSLFGESICFQFELGDLSITYEDAEVLPEPVVVKERKEEVKAFEEEKDIELSEGARVNTAQMVEQSRIDVEQLDQKRSELEGRLRSDFPDANTWLELIRIHGALGQAQEIIDGHNAVDDPDSPAHRHYEKALEFARKAYRIPRWREVARRKLRENVPLLFLVEAFLIPSHRFEVEASKRLPGDPPETGSMALRYIGSESREALGDQVFVNLVSNEQARQEEQNLKTNQWFPYAARQQSVFLVLTGKLIREDVRRVWEWVRLLRELRITTAVFLEAAVVIDQLLGQKSEREAERRVILLIQKWVEKSGSIAYNSVPRGYDFYGRREEIQQYLGYIQNGQNFHLVGLRRSGKTSVIYNLGENNLSDHLFAFVDARSYSSCADLTRRLVADLFADARMKYPEVDWSQAKLHKSKPDQHYTLDAFITDMRVLLSLLPPQAQVAYMVDEIEEALPGDERQGFADWWEFLQAVKTLNDTDHPDYKERFVFITAGRNPVITSAWIQGKANPLHGDRVVYLSTMKTDDCRMMIEDLGFPIGIDFTDDQAFQEIMRQTGGHAHTVRVLCDVIASSHRQRPLLVNAEMVRQASYGLLSASTTSNTRQVLREIIYYLTPLEFDILNRVSAREEPTWPGDILQAENKKDEKEVIESLIDLGLLTRERTPGYLEVNIGLVKYLSR